MKKTIFFLAAAMLAGTGYEKGATLSDVDEDTFEKLKKLGLAKEYDAEVDGGTSNSNAELEKANERISELERELSSDVGLRLKDTREEIGMVKNLRETDEALEASNAKVAELELELEKEVSKALDFANEKFAQLAEASKTLKASSAKVTELEEANKALDGYVVEAIGLAKGTTPDGYKKAK